jgi:hypothetical protein
MSEIIKNINIETKWINIIIFKNIFIYENN